MKNTVKISVLAAAMAAGAIAPAAAQKKAAPQKAKPIAAKTATGKKADGGFIVLPSGLQYKIVKHGNSTRKPVMGDNIEMFIHVHIADSVLFDSRKMYNKDNPVPFPISATKFKGDPMEGFMLMTAGDSAVLRVPVDSMKKAGNQMLPWMKDGQMIEYDVVLVSVRSEAEKKKHDEEKANAQKSVDEKLMSEYFTKNHISAKKTASGLAYTVSKEGTGEPIKAGETISVNYTGKLLDGKAFDSNVDSAFHHMEPFSLEIGKGRVIKGWDEGLLLFKKGGKGTLYIPSGLAYGAQDQRNIPANSILVFDVEVVDVKTADDLKRDAEEKKKEAEAKAEKQKEADDHMLKEYFAKNHIEAKHTSSGLYYTVSRPGSGETAQSGQAVTVNYSGRILDGKTFDSNTDTAFHHTDPFKVELGKGRVIKGWDEGLQLLSKGEKATLYIPSGMAYGDRGNRAIPANSILVFDIEVLDVQTPVDQASADDKLLKDYFEKNHIEAKKTNTGLYYAISQKGTGDFMKPGKKVSMNYTGKTMDGKVFDSNTDPKFGHVQPFQFQLGAGQVIRGWDEGVQLLQMGSKGTLYIPSALGYGPSGMGSAIPPNAVLIFDVEVTGANN